MIESLDYGLVKWRYGLLMRDGQKCVMCKAVYESTSLQAHHIHPRSLYPEIQYEDYNGVILCTGCHMGIVHGGNSFLDVTKTHHWKFFVPSFVEYVRKCSNE